jgi:hypothetical protein
LFSQCSVIGALTRFPLNGEERVVGEKKVPLWRA